MRKARYNKPTKSPEQTKSIAIKMCPDLKVAMTVMR
jgi:hypothetical protein